MVDSRFRSTWARVDCRTYSLNFLNDHGLGGNWRRPEAWSMALTSSWMFWWSRPVMVAPRLTGLWSARLAARWSIFFSPLEQGNSPAFRAVTAAGQSIRAIWGVASVRLG